MGFSRPKSTGVGCQALLQGIFRPKDWTRVSYSLLHWRADSSPLVPPGKPKLDVTLLSSVRLSEPFFFGQHSGLYETPMELSLLSCVQILYDPMDNSFLCPWDFPGNNTGVGCHFLLQSILLNQGSNLCFLQVHVANFIASGFWNRITMKGSWELNYVIRELCFYFCCILVTENIIVRQDGIRQTS